MTTSNLGSNPFVAFFQSNKQYRQLLLQNKDFNIKITYIVGNQTRENTFSADTFNMAIAKIKLRLNLLKENKGQVIDLIGITRGENRQRQAVVLTIADLNSINNLKVL